MKDVNCNVCGIVICYSSEQEPEPCEISITDIGQDKKYCPGDTIVLNWNGTTPSGTVNLSLFDNTNATVYQVIATNLPNTGTYTYTIPSGIPCDPPRSWSLIVEDSERLCLDRSDPFTIECCQQQTDCNCGEWLTDYVTVTIYLLPIPQNPDLKITIPASDTNAVTCGKNIELKPSKYYTFTAPDYACNPENCDVSYIWSIVDTKNNIIQSGKGKTFNYSFSNFGNYEVIFTPICGGIRCEPCTIYVEVEKPIIAEPLPVPNKY